MIIYVAHNGNPIKFKTINEHPQLGFMFNPIDYRRNYKGRYALDNGAFGAYSHGYSFDDGAFIEVLGKLQNPDFAVIPDKVAQGKVSLKYSTNWRTILPDSFNWYLAVQDGMNYQMIPDSLLRKIAGIFVGGSPDWKDHTSKYWIDFAHTKGLKAHIGRYGTLWHLMKAQQEGADSIDGSNAARHEKNWNELTQFLDGEHKPLAAFIPT